MAPPTPPERGVNVEGSRWAARPDGQRPEAAGDAATWSDDLGHGASDLEGRGDGLRGHHGLRPSSHAHVL
eukprot:9818755-Heterocapsa_arctica.AAC.1